MKKLSFIVFVSLGLTACASQYLTHHENIVAQSRNGEKLIVPPPLTSERLSSYYDLPAQTQVTKVSVAPPLRK